MVKIILYYNFKSIDDPKQFCQEHLEKCKQLNLLGRVYIASEGINGTLAGIPEDIDSYEKFLREQKNFSDTEFKEDFAGEAPFERLIVKEKNEIVALKTDEVLDPQKDGGEHLSPQQWLDILNSDEDITLIDVRNNYESEIGHFDGAIRPDLENFYDFPKWLEESKLEKDKKVLMYCTGGIRCEVFSVFMKKKGYKNVGQLHGGILNYKKEVGDDHYKGKCFVFDDRLAVPIEKDQKEALTKCEITGVPCDTYLNCANCDCNRLFICSKEGAVKMQGCCSETCKSAPRKRPINVENIYGPFRRWYNYFEEKTKDGFGKLKTKYERMNAS